MVFCSNKRKGPISLTGSIRMLEEEYGLEPQPGLQYPTAPYYNALWGWREFEMADEFDIPAGGYVDDSVNVNVLMHQGHTFYIDPNKNEFGIVEIGKGHWDNNTYIGCDKVRRGELAQFKPPSWTNYIEA